MAEENKPGFNPAEETRPEGRDKSAGKFSEQMGLSQKETIPTPELFSERREGSAEEDNSYAKILSKVKAGSSPPDEVSIKDDAHSVSEEKTAESKINNLVNLAMQKGVIHAVKVARHLEDNYALDEMHDRLIADELHDALVKKGLLKEV